MDGHKVDYLVALKANCWAVPRDVQMVVKKAA